MLPNPTAGGETFSEDAYEASHPHSQQGYARLFDTHTHTLSLPLSHPHTHTHQQHAHILPNPTAGGETFSEDAYEASHPHSQQGYSRLYGEQQGQSQGEVGAGTDARYR